MPTPSFAPAPPTVRSCRHTTRQQPTPGFAQLTAKDPATVTAAVAAVRCAFGELNWWWRLLDAGFAEDGGALPRG